MRLFLIALLLFPLGFAHAQSVQTSEDINLAPVTSAQTDSLEVEITFHLKDLSSEGLEIYLGPEEGSGEYAVIFLDVKEEQGKKVVKESGKSDKELVNGTVVVRKRIPKEAAGKDVHVQVNGKDNAHNNKYKVSKKVKLNQ